MSGPGTRPVTRVNNSAEKKLYGVGNRGGQRYDRSDSGPPVQGFSLLAGGASCAVEYGQGQGCREYSNSWTIKECPQ